MLAHCILSVFFHVREFIWLQFALLAIPWIWNCQLQRNLWETSKVLSLPGSPILGLLAALVLVVLHFIFGLSVFPSSLGTMSM